jgi:hypothetical protein
LAESVLFPTGVFAPVNYGVTFTKIDATRREVDAFEPEENNLIRSRNIAAAPTKPV